MSMSMSTADSWYSYSLSNSRAGTQLILKVIMTSLGASEGSEGLIARFMNAHGKKTELGSGLALAWHRPPPARRPILRGVLAPGAYGV